MTRTNDTDVGSSNPPIKQPRRQRNSKLRPEAQRALAEADARRNAAAAAPIAEETGGRGGLEPTRYGDWERKGLVSDF